MRKTGKGLAIAALLIILGAAIFIGGITMNKWDFSRLSTRKMQTVEHEITENFTNICIMGSTADIVFEVKTMKIARLCALRKPIWRTPSALRMAR